jgi:hypothetical protein
MAIYVICLANMILLTHLSESLTTDDSDIGGLHNKKANISRICSDTILEFRIFIFNQKTSLRVQIYKDYLCDIRNSNICCFLDLMKVYLCKLLCFVMYFNHLIYHHAP